ncbi:ExbD/TolR family protein [Neisseriaceae bacterium B1]
MSFGSMNDGGDNDTPMSDINVTPLVDVMLVLLIVFMITMPVLTHSVEINLPVSGSKTAQEQQMNIKPIEIGITADGQYTIGAESSNKMDFETVKVQLMQLGQQNPNTILAIDADKNAAYDHVLKVLEAAREAKLIKIGFRTEVQNTAAQ